VVDFALIALYGAAGFWTADYLLRNRLDRRQTAIAILAGTVLNLLISVVVAIIVLVAFRLDTLVYAFLGSVVGPSVAAVFAWRWRPKRFADNDLRAKD
jgi:hypothetical protein